MLPLSKMYSATVFFWMREHIDSSDCSAHSYFFIYREPYNGNYEIKREKPLHLEMIIIKENKNKFVSHVLYIF